jgi:hypothetical protein
MNDGHAQKKQISWTNFPVKEVNDEPDAYDSWRGNSELGTANGSDISDNPNIVMCTLATIRDSIFSLEKEYRRSLAEQLVLAADIAAKMKRNTFLWDEFINADWNDHRKPKPSDQKNALRHVFRWICGPTLSGKQRASFYFRAIGPLVEKGLAGAELQRKLEKKGLKTLSARHAKKRGSQVSLGPIAFKFSPELKRGLWRVRLDVEFDRRPEALFGLAGEPVFTIRGAVKALDAEQSSISVLGYSFVVDD